MQKYKSLRSYMVLCAFLALLSFTATALASVWDYKKLELEKSRALTAETKLTTTQQKTAEQSQALTEIKAFVKTRNLYSTFQKDHPETALKVEALTQPKPVTMTTLPALPPSG